MKGFINSSNVYSRKAGKQMNPELSSSLHLDRSSAEYLDLSSSEHLDLSSLEYLDLSYSEHLVLKSCAFVFLYIY